MKLTRSISTTVAPQVREDLREAAHEEGVTVSEWLRRAVHDRLEK